MTSNGRKTSRSTPRGPRPLHDPVITRSVPQLNKLTGHRVGPCSQRGSGRHARAQRSQRRRLHRGRLPDRRNRSGGRPANAGRRPGGGGRAVHSRARRPARRVRPPPGGPQRPAPPTDGDHSAGPVKVAAPRVNDKRVDEVSGERMRFSSKILAPWGRKSPKISEVLPLLYLHGLWPAPPAPHPPHA